MFCFTQVCQRQISDHRYLISLLLKGFWDVTVSHGCPFCMLLAWLHLKASQNGGPLWLAYQEFMAKAREILGLSNAVPRIDFPYNVWLRDVYIRHRFQEAAILWKHSNVRAYLGCDLTPCRAYKHVYGWGLWYRPCHSLRRRSGAWFECSTWWDVSSSLYGLAVLHHMWSSSRSIRWYSHCNCAQHCFPGEKEKFETLLPWSLDLRSVLRTNLKTGGKCVTLAVCEWKVSNMRRFWEVGCEKTWYYV